MARHAGSQLSGSRSHRTPHRASRLRRAGPPDSRQWHARCLTRAARGAPHPAQTPSLVASEERAALQPVHDARRVDRGVGCLAQRDAVRRASHSRNCGGPGPTLAGRHDRRNRKLSLRKPPARREPLEPRVARRASRGVETPRSAVGAQGTRSAHSGLRAQVRVSRLYNPRATAGSPSNRPSCATRGPTAPSRRRRASSAARCRP